MENFWEKGVISEKIVKKWKFFVSFFNQNTTFFITICLILALFFRYNHKLANRFSYAVLWWKFQNWWPLEGVNPPKNTKIAISPGNDQSMKCGYAIYSLLGMPKQMKFKWLKGGQLFFICCTVLLLRTESWFREI